MSASAIFVLQVVSGENPKEMDDRADILRAMNVCRFCLCNDESELTNIYKKVPESKQAIAVPLPLQIMACVSIEASYRF